MNMKVRETTLCCVAAIVLAGTAMPLSTPTNSVPITTSAPVGMVLVPAGVFTAPFQSGNTPWRFGVKTFFLDTLPVTSGGFLEFVRANPQWRRSQVERRFTDEHYLERWASDLELGSVSPQSPVTGVSWFAARAFAQWKGKRLPKLREWESAAALDDATTQTEILKWYSTPTPVQLQDVGAGRANRHGLHDLHALIWEWVADFDSSLTGDDEDSFCGGGAQSARDPSDYALFMRYAMRRSLQANYCVPNLGFRCAKSCELPDHKP